MSMAETSGGVAKASPNKRLCKIDSFIFILFLVILGVDQSTFKPTTSFLVDGVYHCIDNG
ncbi:MAG: hypothetical protein ACKVOO_06040 [Burkholderiaceae bacterium]